MIEVLTRGSLNYTLCKVLNPLAESGSLEKYCLFQCKETKRIFIGKILAGCWQEIDEQSLVYTLNDLSDKMQLLAIKNQELQEQLDRYESGEYHRQQNLG